jgi:hypothetical protein
VKEIDVGVKKTVDGERQKQSGEERRRCGSGGKKAVVDVAKESSGGVKEREVRM